MRQGLQHVVREIRHAIGDEVRGSDLDRETVSSIRDLQREFRRDLQALFLQAGRGADVDRHEVLEGMMVALQDLTAGLRELNDRSGDVVDDAPVASGKPGSLLDITG